MTEETRRIIDVTGLPETAIRAIESLVSILQAQGSNHGPSASYEEWSRAFQDWLASHPKRETYADWSRESIYAGRGE